MTDESLDSFVDIVRNVFEFQRDRIPARLLLTPNSSKLLFLIWLRCFLINHLISFLFNIRIITVKKKEITVISHRVIICVLLSIFVLTNHKRMGANVKCWEKIPSSEGAIDGISFEIYRPNTDPKNLIIRDIYVLFMHRL